MEQKSPPTISYRLRISRDVAGKLATVAEQEGEAQTVIARRLLREGLDRLLVKEAAGLDRLTPAGATG